MIAVFSFFFICFLQDTSTLLKNTKIYLFFRYIVKSLSCDDSIGFYVEVKPICDKVSIILSLIYTRYIQSMYIMIDKNMIISNHQVIKENMIFIKIKELKRQFLNLNVFQTWNKKYVIYCELMRKTFSVLSNNWTYKW